MNEFRIAVLLNGSERIEYYQTLTNLWRINQGLKSDSSQIAMYYDVANATAKSNTLVRLIMHFTGHGYLDFLENIYNDLLVKIRRAVQLNQLSQDGVLKISLFGFSDGATLARHFGNEYIRKRLFDDMPADIRALGLTMKLDGEYLFDSLHLTKPGPVAVISRFSFFNFQPSTSGYNTSIPLNTKSYHAVAIDDFDSEIEPLHVEQKSELNEEVWFAGEHLDVGGGYMVPAACAPIAADDSLNYMVMRARENGLTFTADFLAKLENERNLNGVSEIHDQSRRLHFTVRRARSAYVKKNGKISDDLPLIHESAIQRMRIAKKPYYEPLALSPFSETKVVMQDGTRAVARFIQKPVTPVTPRYNQLRKSSSFIDLNKTTIGKVVSRVKPLKNKLRLD